MKKTLTVNINGIIFHIDEDAYNVLNNYLQSIKSHFGKTKGGDEIISDIEARIAEMLKERIGDDRQVVTLDDIEEVINVIGQPSEFGEEFAEDYGETQSSGTKKNTKRLYRDPDNSILGGVAGGMGAYFNTDPVWFRIAFVVACLPGLGTPLLVYIILWIVIPEAKTAVDRLEMKGEKVNISNIEKSVREEINNLKNKFNDFTREAKQTYKKKSADTKPQLDGLSNALLRIAELFVRVVLIFSGIILSVIGITFIVAFVIALFGFGFDMFIIDSEVVYLPFSRFVEFFLGSVGGSVIFQLGLLLLIGVPLIMILYSGISLIFGIKRIKYAGITALNLWLAGLIITAFFSIKVATDFRHKGVHSQEIKLNIDKSAPFTIDLNEDKNFDNIYRYHDFVEIDDARMIITTDRDDLFYGIPELYFRKSQSDDFYVEFVYQSRGSSKHEAVARAENIIYNYKLENNQLFLDPYFKLKEREVWRENYVDVIVYVPVGQSIRLNRELKSIISYHKHSPYKLAGDTWVMTDTGLEESDYYIPLIEDEETDQPEEPEIEENNAPKEKPVSMLSFIKIGLDNIL